MNERTGRDELERVAGEQVGVGTPPGEPPATGTGPRPHDTATPITGGRADERAATLGADADEAGGIAVGGQQESVGGVQGTTPDQAVADIPEPDDVASPEERVGVIETDRG